MEVIHAAIPVTSLKYSLAFYVDGLGLTDRWGFERDGIRHRYLGGSDGAEIQLIDDPDANEPDSGGVDHVALEVSALDEAFVALTERTSCPVVDSPTTLAADGVESRYAFVEDPDGHIVELVERSAGHPATE
jgi:lactoylglutathione lyase